MLSIQAAIVILTVLGCNFQVRSDKAKILVKKYNINNDNLIIGKHNIDKTTLAYALCERSSNKSFAKCSINFEEDVIDKSKSNYSCTLNIAAEYEDRKIDILDIQPWGVKKIIFVWQVIIKPYSPYADVMINIVHLEKCESTQQALTVSNRIDLKPQIFVIAFENSYSVVYMNKEKCKNYFCRMIVDGESGEISLNERWFSNTGLVHSVEPLEGTNTYLVCVMETSQQETSAKFYLTGDLGRTVLGAYDTIDYFLGWSTTNRMISFCSYSDCLEYNYNGLKTGSKSLTLAYPSTKYAALYNLPSGEKIALICDHNPDSFYHVIRIGTDGKQKSIFELDEIKCSKKPQYLSITFYTKTDKEYCLSLFHSVYERMGVIFSNFCFTISNS